MILKEKKRIEEIGVVLQPREGQRSNSVLLSITKHCSAGNGKPEIHQVRNTTCIADSDIRYV